MVISEIQYDKCQRAEDFFIKMYGKGMFFWLNSYICKLIITSK